MPTLLELQHAMRRSLAERQHAQAAAHILADGLAAEDRLEIYRNTFLSTLSAALRLAYPAVERLVGAAFFEGAAHRFIERHPPASAYLNEYGAAFPGFLAEFPPAATLAYLADVARLEWAVNRALHAPDASALDLGRLGALDPADHARLRFLPHPALGLVAADHPADAIWRAVLERDDAALAAIDLAAGPVRLLVERGAEGLAVSRLDKAEWRFIAALCAGCPLEDALGDTLGDRLEGAGAIDAPVLLAGHLAAGRFVGYRLDQESQP